MADMLLPEDPNGHEILIMGDPYKNALTPKLASEKRAQDMDAEREKQSKGGFKYASSMIAPAADPWYKQAQMTGVNNIMTQPMWFSPLHTPQNWQIASKRREIYQWAVTNDCEVLCPDFTFKSIEDLIFDVGEVIEDNNLEGGVYELRDSESIFSGYGVIVKPTKFGYRRAYAKIFYSFSSLGYWREIKTSEEHPMIVLDGNLYRQSRRQKNQTPIKPVRKMAADVSPYDYLLSPVPKVGETNIDQKKAWLIGNCIADGTFSKIDSGHYQTRITLSKNDNHLQHVSDCLGHFTGTVSGRPHGNGLGWSVCNSSKECWMFLNSYIQGKGTSKKFSDKIFDLDRESRLHILGGYFDGDGSFSKSEQKIIANNYSKDMADQLYWMLLSVGVKASLKRYPLYGDHYETDSTWVYRIFIPRSDVSIIAPYMNSGKVPNNFESGGTRELRFFYEDGDNVWFAQPIDEIRQFRHNGVVYDIQIDEDHSFIGSGFATSNCRFFYENEPKVAAAIDFYSRFPMNGFDMECTSREVLQYFKHHVVKRLNLNEMFKMISSEYFMLGDVFIHLNVDCPVCKGTAVDPETGEQCNHPGGSFDRLVVLNPDWVEVQQSVLVDEPSVVMIPDEELKRIIFLKQPKQIYDRIPAWTKKLVAENKPIPLSNRTVSHLKHMPVPYGTYGTSLIRRLFTTLAYKTKIMTANWIVAERLILPVRVVKIGSDERPATTADISDVQQQLAATANDPNLTIVTHHNFEYEWYGATGKILQVTQEMEYIGKEILDGFMLNQSLLNGEMSGYQSAQVGVETLIRRIESWRQTLAEWCEKNIFLPIAEMQGFVDQEKSEEVGEICYLYPKIKWNDLQLKDKNQWYQTLMQLHQTQVISTQTLLEELDLDYDQEVKRMRYEQIQVGPAGGMLGGGGMPGGMGAGGAGGGAPGGEGGMPMGPMGAPGMGGGMGGGMDMGGGGMGGAGGGMGGGGMGAAAGGGGSMKITKKGKGGKQEEQEAVPMPMVKLTRIEQEMANMLIDLASNVNISYDNIRAQFPIQNPEGGKPYMLDFAIPKLKLGVECDGEIWHSSPEQESDDKQRDYLLAQKGWTVLRFDDRSIDEAPQSVKQTIAQFVKQLAQGPAKRASKTGSSKYGHLFTASKGKLINLVGDQSYEKYFSGKKLYRVIVHPSENGFSITEYYKKSFGARSES